MNETLFQITCPSCETTFDVTDPELVGQIVACPKCGGMILIEAPGATEEPEKKENPGSTPTEASRSSLAFDKSSPSEIADAPPVIEPEQIETPPDVATEHTEETNDAPTSLSSPIRSVWRSRVILMLLGTICALLCFLALRPFLSRDADVEDPQTPQEVETEEAVVSNREPPEASGELAEEETDVANLVNPNDSTDANDVFGAPNAEDVATTDELAEIDPKESTDDLPIDSEDVGEQTQVEPDDETTDESEENAEDETQSQTSDEEETTVDEETARESEIESVEEEDEGIATDDELESDAGAPTEFDEAEFEKANQAESNEETDEEQEEDLGAVASTTEVGLQNALPTLKSEPQKIDVDARMKLPIRSITFPESPAASLRLLSEYSGVPFELDLARFEAMRSSFNATLDLTLENVDVEGALNAVAKELKWNVVKEEGKVVVEPSEGGDASLVEERFDVSDLIGARLDSLVEIGAENALEPTSKPEETLIRLIETLVAPETWESRGGEGRVSFADGSLVVLQDAQNRRCVATLLERLRAMRGLEAKDASIADSLIPETLGWEKLTQKTTLNLIKSVPLQQALEILERAQKFLILWDDGALNDFGYGRDATISANFDSAPLERVLFDLLDPLNFSYVILGENLVLITTKEKAANYRTIEICLYSESEERKTLEEATAISGEMQTAVGAKTWETSDAALWVDLETNCWLIRQSQPIQREIRRWASGKKE